MYRDYESECEAENRAHLGRMPFLKVVKALTRRESRRKACLDYVYVDIFCDKFNTLKEVINIAVPRANSLPLLKEIDSLFMFLKQECRL